MDKLNMDHINSLPQPFIVRFVGGDEWPVHDIDVETGLLRIDVCGKLQVKHIGEATMFRDMDGVEHDAETFYSDYVPNAEAQRTAVAGTLPPLVRLPLRVLVALEAAAEALEDLGACDDPNCSDDNCNHALTKVRDVLAEQ